MSSGRPQPTDSGQARERMDGLVRDALASDAGIAALVALLEEPRWVVRRDVIAALAGLGERVVAALCSSLLHQRQSETRIAATVDALVSSTADVESALLAFASVDVPAVVADVAQILGRRRKPSAVATLVGLLEHPDDNVAVAAIEALGRIGGRAAVDALVANVERVYFFRTYPAIDVLGRSGDPRAVAPLVRLLENPQYRHEAARALGHTADKHAVLALAELLVSPVDVDVRVGISALADLLEAQLGLYGTAAAASETLRRQASEAAVQRISQVLRAADTAERRAACHVLGALSLPSALPTLSSLLDDDPSIVEAAVAALEQLGDQAEEQLQAAIREGDSTRRRILLPLLPQSRHTGSVIACLQDPDPAVRALACDALARTGDVSVVPRLFEHLSDASPRVLQAAMRAIQSLGTEQTQALAIHAARSSAPDTRRAALRILAYFGYPAAIDVISERVHDADARVRDVAVAGLAFVEHPRARVLLLEAAQDPSSHTRVAAMRGLGQSTADSDIVAALEGALGDADAWVRYYACQALGKLGVLSAATRVAVLLADPAGQVRVAAVEALAQLKSPPALALLGTAASANDPDMRRAALIGLGMMQNAESLPVLVAACSDDEAATRMVALSALRAYASHETLLIVAKGLRDADEGVRAAAVGLVASWPLTEATQILIDALREERDSGARAHITQALATAMHGRIAGLLKGLETSDDELAPTLISVLGRLDPSDQTGALFEALRMPNVAARKAAAAILAARGTREARAALTRRSTEDPAEEVRRVCALLLSQ